MKSRRNVGEAAASPGPGSCWGRCLGTERVLGSKESCEIFIVEGNTVMEVGVYPSRYKVSDRCLD